MKNHKKQYHNQTFWGSKTKPQKSSHIYKKWVENPGETAKAYKLLKLTLMKESIPFKEQEYLFSLILDGMYHIRFRDEKEVMTNVKRYTVIITNVYTWTTTVKAVSLPRFRILSKAVQYVINNYKTHDTFRDVYKR
jgi:hypothetical protein